MMRVIQRLGWVLFVVGLPVWIMAQEISFSAHVDRTTLSQDEQLTYELTMSGKIDRSAQLKMPVLDGNFQIVSQGQQSSYSIVNGQVSSSQTKSFILVPLKSGTLTIPAAALIVNGTTYQTQPVTITVKKGSGNAGRPAGSPTYSGGNDPVFLSSNVNKTEAYEGEEIIYELDFCRRTQLWGSISYQMPEFKGFWVENLKAKQEEYTRSSSSGQYGVRELIRRSLFPLHAGTATVTEAKASFVINPFEGDRAVQAKPITIKVKPLPLQGKPSDFSGVVGEFNMSMGTLPKTVSQNQPITVRIDVAGSGGLTRLSELHVDDDPAFKIYKSKMQDAIQFDSRVSGKRSFEYVVIPKSAGKVKMPRFTLSFFSPQSKAYKTVAVGGVELSVLPSVGGELDDQDVVQHTGLQLRQDIRYLHHDGTIHLFRKTLAWVVGILDLIIAGAVLLGVCLRAFIFKNDQDVAYRLAFHNASKRLQKLEKNGVSPAFGELEHILMDFISDRLGISVTGFTSERLQLCLLEKGVPQDLVLQIIGFLERVQAGGYAPSGMGTDAIALTAQLRDILSRLKGGVL